MFILPSFSCGLEFGSLYQTSISTISELKVFKIKKCYVKYPAIGQKNYCEQMYKRLLNRDDNHYSKYYNILTLCR